MGLYNILGKHDSIWAIVDQLMKSAYVLPIGVDYNSQQLAKIYVKKIMRLLGVPLIIISNRDSKNTSIFWDRLHEDLRTKITFSIIFHTQTNGQSERIIQLLEDMMRECMTDFGGHWYKLFLLGEFLYNTVITPVLTWHRSIHFIEVSVCHLLGSLSWKMFILWAQI